VLDTLFELFVEADRGFVALQGDDGQITPHTMKTRRTQDAERIRISRTIIKLVMDTKQAILSSDAAADNRFDLSQSIVEFRIRSMMCAPLTDADGNSFGVIQLDTLRSAIAFDQNDLEVLVTVVVQASLALQKVELFRKAELTRQLEQDLKLAQEVQLRFLPQANPKIADYKFFSYYRPTAQVGGDYFDYIQLNDRQLAIIVADVVGHGVAAALLMAKISADARFAIALNRDPIKAMDHMNKSLSGLNLDKFVTLILGFLDCDKNEIVFVNAGHMPPIIRTANNSVRVMAQDNFGLPLGVDVDAEYAAESLKLEPGDVVLLYTDGVNESMNEKGDQLGLELLVREIEQSQAKTPELLGKSVCQSIKRHVDGHTQFDDICIVCLGR
jgi:serine phosphatase RsbU (regulator of sigma subunit)